MTDSPCSPAPVAAESATGMVVNLHLHDTPAPEISLFPSPGAFALVCFELTHHTGRLNVMASNPAALRAAAAAFSEAAERLEALLAEGRES